MKVGVTVFDCLYRLGPTAENEPNGYTRLRGPQAPVVGVETYRLALIIQHPEWQVIMRHGDSQNLVAVKLRICLRPCLQDGSALITGYSRHTRFDTLQ